MSETKLQSFHLAVPVNDLEEARNFYVNVIGCAEGRSDESRVLASDWLIKPQ